MESIYRAATVVANICIYAATDKAKPIAIIVPAEPALKKLAQSNGIEGNGLEDLVHNRQLNGIVLKELHSTGKQGGLSGIEIIDAVVMADEEWNAANVSNFQIDEAIEQTLTLSRASLLRRKSSIVNPSYRSTKRKLTRHIQVVISIAEPESNTLNQYFLYPGNVITAA